MMDGDSGQGIVPPRLWGQSAPWSQRNLESQLDPSLPENLGHPLPPEHPETKTQKYLLENVKLSICR